MNIHEMRPGIFAADRFYTRFGVSLVFVLSCYQLVDSIIVYAEYKLKASAATEATRFAAISMATSMWQHTLYHHLNAIQVISNLSQHNTRTLYLSRSSSLYLSTHFFIKKFYIPPCSFSYLCESSNIFTLFSFVALSCVTTITSLTAVYAYFISRKAVLWIHFPHLV